MATDRDALEYMSREDLAVLARAYLDTLTVRCPPPTLGADQHAHLLATGHLPARGCCAPALAAVEAC